MSKRLPRDLWESASTFAIEILSFALANESASSSQTGASFLQ